MKRQSISGAAGINGQWLHLWAGFSGSRQSKWVFLARAIAWAAVLAAAFWARGLVEAEVSRVTPARVDRVVYRIEIALESYVFSDLTPRAHEPIKARRVECRNHGDANPPASRPVAVIHTASPDQQLAVSAAMLDGSLAGRMDLAAAEVRKAHALEIASRDVSRDGQMLQELLEAGDHARRGNAKTGLHEASFEGGIAEEARWVNGAAGVPTPRIIPSMADQSPDCLFCKIAAGAIPAKRIHETEETIAFADIHPQAPVHVLVIPKRHIASHAHALPEDAGLLAKLMVSAGEVARQQGLENGYRLVVNTGPDGGQTVDHLHLHVLGGRHMGWPPG